jgi:hypothetical protein
VAECRYNFGTSHPAAKAYGIKCDHFMFGIEPACLLLWWGDIAAMRAGAAKVLDAHAQVLAAVQQGAASALSCALLVRTRTFCSSLCQIQYWRLVLLAIAAGMGKRRRNRATI